MSPSPAFSRAFALALENEAGEGTGDFMSAILRGNAQVPITTEAYDIGYADAYRHNTLNTLSNQDVEERFMEAFPTYSAAAQFLGVKRTYRKDGGLSDELEIALADYRKGYNQAVFDCECRADKGE